MLGYWSRGIKCGNQGVGSAWDAVYIQYWLYLDKIRNIYDNLGSINLEQIPFSSSSFPNLDAHLFNREIYTLFSTTRAAFVRQSNLVSDSRVCILVYSIFYRWFALTT